MDEEHLMHAVRYVWLNPVRVRLVEHPEHWRRSSVGAHLCGEDGGLVRVASVLDRYGAFAEFLSDPADDGAALRALRRSETSGRPIGNPAWIVDLEAWTGRILTPQKRGPKARVRFEY
ncbi:hypothetical protein [Sphingomonas colocasiae]|uniref:Transposase n=1 Tax=Sphingomonas colocasiae TaxID=1848973 RepID=A0ABS7PZF5_9SPHN|nr:hypothetical protein [Sphingomonas colocasiae]MBY8826324.1 hypothetical protein [Sphingomonas colocasiae]